MSYDLYVSVDNGPFSRWLSATRSTSSYYPGASGRRYAFFSVARDAAGNLEAAPGTPDAAAVATGNSAPTLDPVPDVALDEGGKVEMILHGSDQDLPGDTLTYRLVSGPSGVVVDAANGHLTWQTGEADGPGLVKIIVSVTDDGTPPLSSQQTVRILVREVNTAPRLVLPAKEFTVAEGNLLKFTASADDPDLPTNPYRYRLVGEVPAGAGIQSSTGEFRWQPSEAQGGADYMIGIEVNDQGQPAYTDVGNIRVTVTKVNSAPIVTGVKDRVVHEGDLVEITVQAVDHDLPPQVLKYVLAPGAATGAQLNGATGEFVWTPGGADAPGTSEFSVLVSDDQVPPASSDTTFRITVRPLKPGLNLPRRENSGEVSFRFKGQAGLHYMLEGSIDLKAWQPLQDFLAERPIFTLIDRSSAEFPWRFFRARAE